MRRYCTYFDSNYLARAMVLLESLKEHEGEFVLHALCLDDQAYEAVSRLHDPQCLPLSLAEVEAFDTRLLVARTNRSLIEYYFTLSPFLPLYLLRSVPEIYQITYIDADCCYYSPPQPIYDEMGDASILIIEHRFSEEQKELYKYGRFNVGLQVFTNKPQAIACLEQWAEQCLLWCYARLEEGKFADQKYLDAWPAKYDLTHVLQHKGANVAPWNIGNYIMSQRGSQLYVDSEPLIMYHFHGLRVYSGKYYHASGNWHDFKIEHIKLLYGGYLEKLVKYEFYSTNGNMRNNQNEHVGIIELFFSPSRYLPVKSMFMTFWFWKWSVDGILVKRSRQINDILSLYDSLDCLSFRRIFLYRIKRNPTILFNNHILYILMKSFWKKKKVCVS